MLFIPTLKQVREPKEELLLQKFVIFHKVWNVQNILFNNLHLINSIYFVLLYTMGNRKAFIYPIPHLQVGIDIGSIFFSRDLCFYWHIKLCGLFNAKVILVEEQSKLATLVKDGLKAPFSIATTPRWRGRHHSIPWIAPLYPWSLPYNAEY